MKIVGILKQEVEIDASPLTLIKTLIKHYFKNWVLVYKIYPVILPSSFP